jgi:hypothetical protein
MDHTHPAPISEAAQETSMRSLAIPLVVAAFIAATSATAQVVAQVVPTNPPGPTRADAPLRVTSTFRAAVELAPTQLVPDAAAQEKARRALYAMAADECAVLSEIYKSECHLTSMQIAAPLVPNMQPANVLVATATYELRPLRQTPSR